jgi:hypothetical protein
MPRCELGFNFARLPVDYRCYVAPSDWLAFDEPKLREIDEAVAYGKKYGIHVCLNLHRAPGFCINPPKEARDLWIDPAAQAAFIAHWRMFATRYRGVSAAALSFNLVNEPLGSTEDRYLDLFKRTIAAIREVDPLRLILVDGVEGGTKPQPGLIGLPGVVQSTRGYHPFGISHYRAEWVDGASSYPLPVWPLVPTASAYLYGPEKREFKSPLVLRGDFPAGTEAIISVGTVSSRGRLRILADGKPLVDKLFLPGPGAGEWKKSVYREEWNVYQNIYDREYSCVLGAPAKALSISNDEGDWLTMNGIRIIRPGGRKVEITVDFEWGRLQAPLSLDAEGRIAGEKNDDPRVPLEAFIAPWDAIAEKGAAVFVGESGCYNKTPHAVALAWYREWLAVWKERRMGWALWNFRGSFGILDSGRTDVVYEDFHGHKLDRQFLNLLQEYLGK